MATTALTPVGHEAGSPHSHTSSKDNAERDIVIRLLHMGVVKAPLCNHGAGIQRERLPFIQYVLLYRLKTRLFALATADRRPGEREATAGESVGWPRWRRQRLEQTRDTGTVYKPGQHIIYACAEIS